MTSTLEGEYPEKSAGDVTGKNSNKIISKNELNRMIDTQIQQHELIEDNEDYLISGEFTKIHFKFGLPVFISDLIQYLTGKLLHNSHQNIEEEADKEKAKLMNLTPSERGKYIQDPSLNLSLTLYAWG